MRVLQAIVDRLDGNQKRLRQQFQAAEDQHQVLRAEWEAALDRFQVNPLELRTREEANARAALAAEGGNEAKVVQKTTTVAPKKRLRPDEGSASSQPQSDEGKGKGKGKHAQSAARNTMERQLRILAKLQNTIQAQSDLAGGLSAENQGKDSSSVGKDGKERNAGKKGEKGEKGKGKNYKGKSGDKHGKNGQEKTQSGDWYKTHREQPVPGAQDREQSWNSGWKSSGNNWSGNWNSWSGAWDVDVTSARDQPGSSNGPDGDQKSQGSRDAKNWYVFRIHTNINKERIVPGLVFDFHSFEFRFPCVSFLRRVH